MSFRRLFSPAQWRRVRRLLALSMAEGAVTGLFLPLVNYAALNEIEPEVLFSLVLGYALLVLLSYGLRYYSGSRIAFTLDEVLRDTRARVARGIQSAQLQTSESIPDLQTAFTRDIERLEELPYKLISFLRYGLVLVSVAVYIVVISPDAFVLWLGLVATIVLVLYPEVLRSRAVTKAENQQWSRFHAELRAGLDAFKQLKLDAAARRSYARTLQDRSERLTRERIRRDSVRHNMQIRGSFIMLLGVAGMLFLAPIYMELEADVLFQVVTILFYTVGPATAVARELHTFVAAEVSFRSLEQLEVRLGSEREPEATDELDPRAAPPKAGTAATDFERLELRGLSFDYLDDEGQPSFRVGPIDLSVGRGELIIIRGGNGSGKTTLMKLLTGLYRPSRGSLCVDGVSVEGDIEAHRERFTALFSDHHLFTKLYGIDATPAEVHALLERFKLAEVTSFERGRFTKLDLSAGQRKRLAMVVALLERRPILVFDEWDAHQDPQLRHDYYTRLLPELRAEGKILFVVSHDERHFHRADQLLHLHEGRVLRLEAQMDSPDARANL